MSGSNSGVECYARCGPRDFACGLVCSCRRICRIRNTYDAFTPKPHDLAAAQQRYSQALVRTAKAAAELRRLTSGAYPGIAENMDGSGESPGQFSAAVISPTTCVFPPRSDLAARFGR